jgi:Domain of unknown function (DUF4263)
MAYPVALDGLRDYAEGLRPEVAPWEEYERCLWLAWRSLLGSPAGQIEANLQAFLEQHPCLLPGCRSMSGHSGHHPYPAAVIRQPRLPGLTTRRPDFCWIATDSECLYAILIEIETPGRQWFQHGKGPRRGDQHGDLVHARGQLDHWKAWFAKPDNQMGFRREYRLNNWLFEERELVPQYVLVHGSRREFDDHPDLNGLRRSLQDQNTFMMTFDRLAPSRDAMSYCCVQITERGYEAVAVPRPSMLTRDISKLRMSIVRSKTARTSGLWDDRTEQVPSWLGATVVLSTPFSQVSGHLFAVYAAQPSVKSGSRLSNRNGSGWKAGPATQSARVSSAPPVL